jgi:hypothetical protein
MRNGFSEMKKGIMHTEYWVVQIEIDQFRLLCYALVENISATTLTTEI